MKNIIKKFWGVAIVVVLLSSLFVVAPQASAVAVPPFAYDFLPSATAGSPMGITAQGTFVYDFAVAPSSQNVIWAATSDNALKSTDQGRTWQHVYTGNTTTDDPTDLVVVAPDDANVVVYVSPVGTGPLGERTVKITLNSGISWFPLGLPKSLAGVPVTKIWDVDVSEQFTDLYGYTYRYVAVVGQNGTVGGSSAFYYCKFGTGISLEWRNAVIDAPVSGQHYTAFNPLDTAFVAVKFSPAFKTDNIVYLLSTNGTYVHLQVCSLNIAGRFNTGITGYSYYADTGLNCFTVVGGVAKAQIIFKPDYVGVFYDPYYRTAYASCAGGTSGGGIVTIAENVDGVPAASGTIVTAMWSIALSPAGVLVGGAAYSTALFSPASAPQMKRVGGGSNAFGGIDDVASQLTLYYAGANLLCAKQGDQASFLLSTDDGKTFNGISLVNTTMDYIDDFAIEPIAGIEQYIVSHGNSMQPFGVHAYLGGSNNATSVWYYDGTYWERVFIRASIQSPASGPLVHRYQIKTSPNSFNVVYLGDTENATIYYTSDFGMANWRPRIAPLTGTLLADLEIVDDANLYAATNVGGMGYVCPLTFSGLYWNASDYIPVFGSSTHIFSLTLVSAEEVIAGSQEGGKVAYTTTGGNTPPEWSVIPGSVGTGGTNIVTEALSLAAGSVVYATPTNNGHATVYYYVLGSSAAGWTADGPSCYTGETGYSVDLLIYGTGTGQALYYLSGNNTGATATFSLTRMLFDLGGWCGVCGWPSWAGRTPDALKGSDVVVSGSQIGNQIWFTDMYGDTIWPSPMRGFGETLGLYPQIEYVYDTDAYTIPTLTGPVNGYIVQVNKETGIGYDVTLTWTGGPAYVQISKDATFTDIKAAGCASSPVNAGPWAINPAFKVNWQPGEIYYWRIRFTATCGAFFCTHWSEARTLNIQPTPIPVPELYAPVNGGSVETLTPAFSWSPMSGTASGSGITTTYTFQLGTDPNFTVQTLIYTTTATNTTGIELPAGYLIDGSTYYWRVSSTIVPPGDWSATASFTVHLPTVVVTPTSTVIITTAPATVGVPSGSATHTDNVVNPSYIWAIIIIGAVLVVAIIVLIFRIRPR
jgi:hypothetical protein